MGAVVTMEVGVEGVAVISFFNPPLNVLTFPGLDELKIKFAEAHRRDDVRAVVFTCIGSVFSAGVDINSFRTIQDTEDDSIFPPVSFDLIVNTIEDAGKPTVAAIQGLALGGGLEIALGCHARIAVPKAKLRFPELSIGIIPGFGGTQRMPRLIGVPKAVDMILFGKSMTSEEGYELGAIDAIVPLIDLLKVSKQWALDIVEHRRPWVRSLHMTEKIGSFFEAHNFIKSSRKKLIKMIPNTPYNICLDVIEEGIIHGGYEGLLKEEKSCKELMLSEISKGLVHTFLAQRAIRKVPGVSDLELKPRPVKKAAVIGCGLMGSGIATVLILSNIPVVLKEINFEYLQKGIGLVKANLSSLALRGKLTMKQQDRALSILKAVLDYSEFKDVDLVIEAAVENVDVKQKILVEMEEVCPPHCIIATNTSTMDLDIIGKGTHCQHRIIGAHFFSPAHLMPLLEIVRTDRTSSQVILDVMNLGKIMKKSAIVVRNSPGFAVNRTFFPYAQGAHLLANLGVDVFRIDQVMVDFGFPVGPFQLQDLSGYVVANAVRNEFVSVFRDRTFVSPILHLLLKNGRDGKNNGKGYYIYEKGKKPKPDPLVLPIIEESRRIINIMPNGKAVSVTDEEIVEMVLFPVVNEACNVLEDGVVVRASDLDIASVLGMGFPSFRGGIVFWADRVGPKRIFHHLERLSRIYGRFFAPSRFLEERATKDISLSAPAWISKEPHFSRL